MVDFHKNLGMNALNDVDNWIDFAFVFLVIAHYTSNTLSAHQYLANSLGSINKNKQKIQTRVPACHMEKHIQGCVQHMAWRCIHSWILSRLADFDIIFSLSMSAAFCTFQCFDCGIIRPFHLFNLHKHFYAPGLKGPPGASSNRIVRPFVCLSVCLSVRNSVPLTNKVQYLKFGWWYSNQT